MAAGHSAHAIHTAARLALLPQPGDPSEEIGQKIMENRLKAMRLKKTTQKNPQPICIFFLTAPKTSGMPPTHSHKLFPTLARDRNTFFFPLIFHISQKKGFLTRPQTSKSSRSRCTREEWAAAAADPGEGSKVPPCSRIPAGGSCRCHARHQMGNLAPPEMLPRPAGSAESCPGCCHRWAGGGDVPRAAPASPGTRAANAAVVEVTCRGSGAGSPGFPPQKHVWSVCGLPQPSAPGGWEGTGLHPTNGLRGTRCHPLSPSLLRC